MRIFHIATAADWSAARASGSYTTSTRGRTLAEEGFIHASRGDQWQGVRERFYADVTEPLVLLVIDTDRLTSPVVDEAVPTAATGTGSETAAETFPHVYGPLDVGAVVQVLPLDAAGAAPRPRQASFSRVFLDEVYHRVTMALAVLVLAVLGTLLGLPVDDRWGPVAGAVVGAAAGVAVAVRLHRRRIPLG